MSLSQAAANRANARASTGPKTSIGKARAAQNARRHGLAVAVLADAAGTAEVETLAHQIAEMVSQPDLLPLARRIAEAQIDLRRIRQARHELLRRAVAEADRTTAPNCRSAGVSNINPDSRNSAPRPPSTDPWDALLASDRYERRALSRRKFAIRELDAARGNYPP